MPPQPLTIRDFSRGVYRQASVNTFLVPKNSVADSTNILYDQIIGSAVVRPGTTLVGSQVIANKIPLGLAEYVSSKGTVYNNLIAVFSGASTATVYYFDTTWHASGLTTLSNTAKNRFTMLGNQIFQVNGQSVMRTSSDGGATWGTTNSIDSGGTIKPTLILRTKSLLLASGDTSQSPSRVFFSSVIDPTTSPGTITWNTNSSTGDWIDINPDDGDTITAFANTSAVTLVFKNNGMYRLNVIQKTVDTDNIFNIGAVSQEGVINCQGITYFFSGLDIRQTNGDYPEQISRLGVQDFIDAISQSNWSSVSAGTDGLNVYFSIGTVTLFANSDDSKTYTNCVLKFSPRDQTWSVHQYAQYPSFFTQFTTTTNGRKMIEADTGGNVQTVNVGQTDNTSPIFFELITQEQENVSRATTNILSDKVVVYTNFGIDSSFQTKSFNPNEKDFKTVEITLNNRVNIGNLNTEGNFFQFRWFGYSSGQAPVLEGIELPTIDNQGIIKNG